MLKSILLRMLAFALAFVVGTGHNVLPGNMWVSKPTQSHQMVKAPIKLTFEEVGTDKARPYLKYTLSNNSPGTIWCRGSYYSPHYCMQKKENNQWIDIACVFPHLNQSFELKPNSTARLAVFAAWDQCPQRIGIEIFWSIPPEVNSDFFHRHIPYGQCWVIWSEPFKIQYQP
ncbi:MAG: hypothetical protein HY774_03185 [Acidobacteria bacterium]|nr:hypothetical protein [Acidobacteriota bacterium]